MTKAGILALLVLLLAAVPPEAPAQDRDEVEPDEVERGLQRRPGVQTDRPELPDYEEEQDVPLALPEVDNLELPRAGLAAAPSLYLKRVLVTDSTVLNADSVGKAVAPYVDRHVTADELQALRADLSRLYIDQGYITSGVLLPDQRVADGTISYQAVEGRLAEVEVSTDGRLRGSYVRSRLESVDGDGPLNVERLREELRSLHQDPLIQRLDSRLLPTRDRGRARLQVAVQEARAYELDFSVRNDRAPSVGSEWAELSFVHRNLLGFADRAYLRYGTADGLDDYQLTYAFPVTGRGATLGFSYANSEAQVVEEPFDRIDIRSEAEEWAVDFVYPWYRSQSRSLTFTASLESRESNTSLLGVPFSFSPGVQNGNAQISALRLTGDWTDRQARQVIALRGRVSVGFDGMSATINPENPNGIDLPDSEFVTFLGQAQWARRFGDNDHQLIVRADLQKTFDGLLPLEKMSIGGLNSVRGYRQNLMVRDNGWIVSAEYRIPAFHSADGRSSFQWAVFLDAGRGWNYEFNTPEPKSIASAGGGFLWTPIPGLKAEVYLAHGFEDVEFADEDPQDNGIHVSLTYRLF
ncbi:MAG: ShlB/FhaC/HecB family hemolysin secretion/activation protein [Xanthomonadales bacterium]|nr:ShlB/FhaC/HecB family hemolysin secretion/activation protein [Xanthomonadales bacterium]